MQYCLTGIPHPRVIDKIQALQVHWLAMNFKLNLSILGIWASIYYYALFLFYLWISCQTHWAIPPYHIRFLALARMERQYRHSKFHTKLIRRTQSISVEIVLSKLQKYSNLWSKCALASCNLPVFVTGFETSSSYTATQRTRKNKERTKKDC